MAAIALRVPQMSQKVLVRAYEKNLPKHKRICASSCNKHKGEKVPLWQRTIESVSGLGLPTQRGLRKQ